jgi:hypothetical protein
MNKQSCNFLCIRIPPLFIIFAFSLRMAGLQQRQSLWRECGYGMCPYPSYYLNEGQNILLQDDELSLFRKATVRWS